MSYGYILTGNRWAFLGLGFTIENRTEGADVSPYIAEHFIDPKWLEVIKSGALIMNGEK
jgi:hypothetical protein